jgi:uncharacterized DUF497 family protein
MTRLIQQKFALKTRRRGEREAQSSDWEFTIRGTLLIVHTERGERIRIIGARLVTKKEEVGL